MTAEVRRAGRRRNGWPRSAWSCRRWPRRWRPTCPRVRTGNYVYTAGQLPMVDGALLMTGKVGAGVTTEEAAGLARVCALNALAAVASVTGSLSAVRRIVKVTGFVASAPDFTGQAQVINGASELLLEVFGEAGQARPQRGGDGGAAAGLARSRWS